MSETIRQCTPDNPYTAARDRAEPGYRWEHQDVSEVPDSQRDNYPCGDLVTMRCNTCGIEWTKELPQ